MVTFFFLNFLILIVTETCSLSSTYRWNSPFNFLNNQEFKKKTCQVCLIHYAQRLVGICKCQFIKVIGFNRPGVDRKTFRVKSRRSTLSSTWTSLVKCKSCSKSKNKLSLKTIFYHEYFCIQIVSSLKEYNANREYLKYLQVKKLNEMMQEQYIKHSTAAKVEKKAMREKRRTVIKSSKKFIFDSSFIFHYV